VDKFHSIAQTRCSIEVENARQALRRYVDSRRSVSVAANGKTRNHRCGIIRTLFPATVYWRPSNTASLGHLLQILRANTTLRREVKWRARRGCAHMTSGSRIHQPVEKVLIFIVFSFAPETDAFFMGCSLF
jgi:hypothetical protein